MPENNEHHVDRAQGADDMFGAFEAFRTRRSDERVANEPFPAQYMDEPTAHIPLAPPPASEVDYHGVPDHELPERAGSAAGRGRPRSTLILAASALFVVGTVAGIYAASDTSGPATSAAGRPAASAPTGAAASAAPTGTLGAPQQDTQNGKPVLLRLTVTAVNGDSFTATTAAGVPVTVLVTASTRFGAAARPFSRADLVPGAVVALRGRRAAAGATVTAIVIAGPPAPDAPPTSDH